MWNLIREPKERSKVQDVWEQSTEENIWIQQTEDQALFPRHTLCLELWSLNCKGEKDYQWEGYCNFFCWSIIKKINNLIFKQKKCQELWNNFNTLFSKLIPLATHQLISPPFLIFTNCRETQDGNTVTGTESCYQVLNLNPRNQTWGVKSFIIWLIGKKDPHRMTINFCKLQVTSQVHV